MRVAFFPYGIAHENPYQKLLRTALEERGVEVICLTGRKWFPLLQCLTSKADVIHFFWPHDLYMGKNTVTRILKRIMLWMTLPVISRLNVVYSAENIASHSNSNKIDSSELKHIHAIVRRCKGIVYMQSAAPAIFKQHYPNAPQLHVIVPHVHYLSVYPNRISRSAARIQLAIPESAYAYLIAGRIEPYKGIEQAIKIFQQVSAQEDRLLIAGKCSSPEYLEQLRIAAHNDTRVVFHTQYISNNDLQVFFNAADVMILNYKDIPLNPGSVISARGFGIPIIAPDVPTMQALQTGDLILFDVDSPDGLMIAMRNCRSVLRTYDKQAIASRLSENEPAQVAAKLEEFYRRIQ